MAQTQADTGSSETEAVLLVQRPALDVCVVVCGARDRGDRSGAGVGILHSIGGNKNGLESI